MTCKDCVHFSVCKFVDEEVCKGTKVKDLSHDCKDYNNVQTGNWVSVKDRVPEKGNEDWYSICLTRKQDGKRIVKTGYWDYYHKRFYGFESGFNFEVTHWQPLPEPPKGDDTNAD